MAKKQSTKIEAPVVETPVVETPVVETPVVETKVEETKVEETKVEETKVEEPKVEEPKVEEPKVEETKVDETPTQRASGVGKRVRELLAEGIMDNKGILAQVQKEFPHGKTSMACIAWYKADMKKKAVDPDAGYKAWLKANDAKLRAEYEATLVQPQA